MGPLLLKSPIVLLLSLMVTIYIPLFRIFNPRSGQQLLIFGQETGTYNQTKYRKKIDPREEIHVFPFAYLSTYKPNN